MNPIIHSIRHNRIPGQLVVQITDRCNARCPQCGMRTTATFRRSTLSTDTIRRLIDAAADRGVQAISFTGGEPLLDLPRLTALINHAGAAGIPFIRTGTNGFIFQHADRSDFTDRIKRIVDQLAATPLRNFWISLDSSVDALHEEMRGFPGVVAGIEKALPIFHAAGIYPAVNLGINRNVGGASTRELTPAGSSSDAAYLETFYHCYQDAFERFYQRAIDLGFTMANACYPMSIDVPESENGLAAVYAATTVADIVRFAPAEKRMLFSALMVAIRRFRARIRIFPPYARWRHWSGSTARKRRHRLTVAGAGWISSSSMPPTDMPIPAATGATRITVGCGIWIGHPIGRRPRQMPADGVTGSASATPVN
ncbi:radical SAM protein [Desulfosarcina cetonica]|uniref:radical SAM protein n=1 Tax=Desulfosarcina cetonica TaxID=90730 RepID=UPI001FEF4881|nr:radical SAM protein [Desulfosarcina cetonica]